MAKAMTRFNRYIVECKCNPSFHVFLHLLDLIDT